MIRVCTVTEVIREAIYSRLCGVGEGIEGSLGYHAILQTMQSSGASRQLYRSAADLEGRVTGAGFGANDYEEFAADGTENHGEGFPGTVHVYGRHNLVFGLTDGLKVGLKVSLEGYGDAVPAGWTIRLNPPLVEVLE
jgi:hypothetical protein